MENNLRMQINPWFWILSKNQGSQDTHYKVMINISPYSLPLSELSWWDYSSTPQFYPIYLYEGHMICRTSRDRPTPWRRGLVVDTWLWDHFGTYN